MWRLRLATQYEVPLGLVNTLSQLLQPRACDEDDLERLVGRALALVWEYK